MNRKNALLSVFHKQGIDAFAKSLHDLGWTIYSSGGTAKFLRDAGLDVIDVATLVGGGAILGHKVVTLSREVHAGLLAYDTPEEVAELERLGIPWIDLVCVDLYPLEDAIREKGDDPEAVRNMTDIGGPTMLRSAAKGRRIVIADPTDRNRVIDLLVTHGDVDAQERNVLAAKAEFIVANYCLASARYASGGAYDGMLGALHTPCKYGENAPQVPAGYFSSNSGDPLGLDQFTLVAGDTPSYNNLCDVDRLLQSITHVAATFAINRDQVPCIAIAVKHGNACGAAIGSDPTDVLVDTVMGDPEAIFGGLLMTNFPIDEALASTILHHGMDGDVTRKLDGIMAPSFTAEAVELLRRKKDKCRFLANPALGTLTRDCLDTHDRYRYVRGGFLRQPNYVFVLDLNHQELSWNGTPTAQQEDDLLLAKPLCDTGNSNTITLVRDGKLIGNGTGQQHRGWSSRLSVLKAHYSNHTTKGAVVASDSFFPVTDGPRILCDNGVAVIFASRGSIADKHITETIAGYGVTFVTLPDSVGRGFCCH